MADEFFQELQDFQNQETEGRLHAGNQLDVGANEAARVLRLRGQTGLPHEVIANDLDYIEKQTELRQFDPKKYRDTNPKYAQFAAENPYNLAVLKDDEESLTRLERVHKALFDWSAVPRAAKSSFAMQEIGMIGDRQRRGEVRPDDEARLKELNKYSVDHDFDTSGFKMLVVEGVKQSANMIGAWSQGLQRAAPTAAAGAFIGQAYGAAGGTIALPGGGTAVGALGGAAAGYGVGFTAGMITGGFEYASKVEGGHAYLEYRELGFTHSDAAWASNIAGNINGVMEAVGGNIIFQKLPGIRSVTGKVGDEVVKQLMGRTTFRQVAGKAVKDWGVGMAGEVVTEIGQESTTMVMGEILKAQNDRDDMLTGDEWMSRIADIAEMTLKSTVLLAGAGPGQRLVMDGRRARKAKAQGLAWQALGESAKDSKLRQNVKPKYREFVDKLTEDGAVDNILIDADRFDTYFQEAGKDPDQVADELGVKNLAEARELGIKVEIPLGAYADLIAPTEHGNGLIKDVSTNLGDMTLRQEEEFESIRADLEAEIEAMSAPDEDGSAQQQIIKDVTGQLIAAGTEQGAAQHQAQIMVGMVNLAERMGMEPTALYDRMFAGVRRDVPKGATQKDVDTLVDPLLDLLREEKFPTQREMMGPSLIDLIKESGGIDLADPELASRDFDQAAEEIGISKAELKRWREKGRSLDDIAGLAAEAGYIASHDEKLLLDAIDAEIRGRPVFGEGAPGDPAMQELGTQLEELASFIEAEGIDLSVLDNAEVRKLLTAGEKFDQLDLTELTELIGALDKSGDVSMLNSIAHAMPHIMDQQDFGDQTFTDTVRISETGDRVQVTQNVQKVFDKEVTRRNGLRKLLGCVSG